MITSDFHTHTIASGHASSNTITDMAKAAATLGLTAIGITDHGPATLGACKPSYFRSLAFAPKTRFGIQVFYGAEVNILDNHGALDLDNSILKLLDYVIASMHLPVKKPESISHNTIAYIEAMKNPYVKILGHPDDSRYPVNYETLVRGSLTHQTLLEINNSSLSPDGYRGDTLENVKEILRLCNQYNVPLLLSSDSHGIDHIGDFTYALRIIKDMNFPETLIANMNSHIISQIFKKKRI